MALDATVGGANSNSFVDESYADNYFASERPGNSWAAGFSSGQQQAGLITATTVLCNYRYAGSAASRTQALPFPRYGVEKPNGGGGFYADMDDCYGDGDYYEPTIIPEPLKKATCELAYWILRNPKFLDNTGLEPFEHVKIEGALDITPRQRSADAIPDYIMHLIAPLLLGGGQARILRG